MIESSPLKSLAVVLAGSCAALQAGAGELALTRLAPDHAIEAFDRVEWRVEAGRSYDNPFDPQQIAIDAHFTAPNGTTLHLPAFWYQSAQADADPAHWRIRFAPTQPGDWTLQVKARDKRDQRESEQIHFTVEPSDHPGFIRRIDGNPRHLRFDSGDPYFLVGLNIAWGGDAGLENYKDWFGELSANGGNYARVWLYPRRIETIDAGLGKLDLKNLAYYDAVLEEAERHGIRVMLTFNNYRFLRDEDTWGTAYWKSNPYNVANGGPIAQPMEFFTNDTVKTLYRAKLRYLVGRYAAFTNIAFWELWNEQDHLPEPGIPTVWVRQMSDHLRDIDPYDHLITTSYSWKDVPAVWELPAIDLTQRHLYSDGSVTDFVNAARSGVDRYDAYGKPHLISEIGITWKGPEKDDSGDFDPHNTGVTLHNVLWTGMMSGTSGTACYWWWDNYVAPKNLWHTFRGVGAFAGAVDWARQRFEPYPLTAPQQATDATAASADIVLHAAATWGRSDDATIEVSSDGRVSQVLPGYFYGPEKPDLRNPTRMTVNLPRDSKLIVRVHKVSRQAKLRVAVDDKPPVDFAFNAEPGDKDQKSTAFMQEHDRYQAIYETDRTIPLKSGRHTIVLDNVEGDWVSIASITLTDAKPASVTDLGVLALRDAASGELLAWVYDPASHWRNDRVGVQQATHADLRLDVPAPTTSETIVAEWWDTRRGEVLRRDAIEATGDVLRLTVPTFQRDIALRVHTKAPGISP